ncbi:uncharacterized protein LOC130986189 [Salvia miltiorrhiza]|uniref:uncharacterized protein LOC130986189 n=1 Tax=Salvia miltiorrhiza TaxID=226208 RepID=UPI0025AC1114|nr:uncharacterized protein LOC130986189 [Salvia miltiorrhiza]
MWPEVKGDLVKPPPKTRMPGRPKKKRVRAPQEKEGRMTKYGVMMSCSNCKQTGHNKRKCTNAALENPNPNKRKRGRPSKDGATKKGSKEKGGQRKKAASEQHSQMKEKSGSTQYKGRGATLKGIGVYVNEATGNSFYHGSTSSKKTMLLQKLKKPRNSNTKDGGTTTQESVVTGVAKTQESRNEGASTQDL